ncbi:class I SAM-dependent methyltransferase [Thermococcus sp. M39]|uniref:class I SAM-dependent methyltransferase n=1 Tax=Thermococcus sp. M39 TaxID=1638262 RepID=UPI001439C53B|nr:class I SAM-dependent methyltransferase [Thermococcus sp. M39]NJE08866.1 class I SAM-dependent methyltransferase [Thermococcus sp. M39]
MYKNLVEIVDANLEQMIRTSLLYVIQLGTKHGIFKVLSKKPSYVDIFPEIEVHNKQLLLDFVRTLIKLGIVEETPTRLQLNGFSYTITVPAKNYSLLLPDWVSSLEEIYRMIDFAFITPAHPHILMDFDKDADFWDMRMSTKFSRVYRKLIAFLGELDSKKQVIDIGCGSVSPLEIGKQVGPNGYYLGIDYSPALLEIARSRIEEHNLDWVELKEIDAHIIKPVNEYDVAVMSFVLEYLKDPASVLRKVMETLKEGGKMIIVEPFRDNFPYIEALEFFEHLNKDFIRFPTQQEVVDAIKKAGFDVDIKSYGKSVLVITRL